jgi:xylulokinase
MTTYGDAYVGLDLGTSSLKGVVVGADGHVLARSRAAYPTHRPVPGAAEQSPADWCAAAADVIAALARLVPARHWGGIGLSGMLPTLVTLDAGGRPTGPALTWEDSRAEAEADGMRDDFGYAVTGQWLDGRYLLPMARRLARTEPERMAVSVTLMGAKDYLLLWLTGVAATDPSTATGYGCYDLTTGRWLGTAAGGGASGAAAGGLGEEAGAAGSPEGRALGMALPPVEGPGTVRPLRAAAARLLGLPEGLPVCTGGADSVLGALGLQGAGAQPGDVVYIAGTSTVIMGISDRLVTDPRHRYLVTPLAVPGRWGLEMDLLSTGSALAWLATLLGLPGGQDELLKLADGVDAADAPAFHPYLGLGEQGALWNASLAGTISGLELRHGPAHLARALVTGIVLESRRCLTVLGGAGDIHVSGRSAASALFLQDLADATGRTVRHPVEGEHDHSAIGAARLAAASIGDLPAERDYAARCVAPRPGRAALWERLAAHHDRALQSLTGLYAD